MHTLVAVVTVLAVLTTCACRTPQTGSHAAMTDPRLTPASLNLERDPPRATPQVRERTFHGVVLRDPYAWLKDDSYPKVDDPQVLAYLEAENAYFEAALGPFHALTKELFEELKSRIPEEDASVPFREGNWNYWWRFDPGAQYRRWLRRPASGGPEEVFLDEPALAEGLDFFRLGGWSVSPQSDRLAWSTDDDGSERFTLRFKNLQTGALYPDSIENTIGAPVWAEDGRTVLYLELNAQWRPFRVRAHRLGDDVSSDRILYEEQDGSFFVGIDKSRDNALLFITTGDHVTSEIRILPARDPLAEPVLVAAREPNHDYEVDSAGDTLYIRTNDTHKNFRVVTSPVSTPDRAHWRELIAGSTRHYLRGVSAFKDFLVIQEREDGLDQIRIRTHAGAEHRVAFPEAAYGVGLGPNSVFDASTLRVHYESMVTPDTVFDYHIADRRLETRKVMRIPAGYDRTRYRTERWMVTARDGARVPVSLVYRDDFKKGEGPVHLSGYGAYGYGLVPRFSTARLSLLDRGFAFALAHVRGGDEMGYHWYEDGKLDRRTNTFHDFIDVAKALVDRGYAKPGGISISGGSAGGELVGAVLNLEPSLWRAAIANVPFVDVLNTMLDVDLPLTPMEWPEWGNPIEDPEAFRYIRSYSPYDQVRAQAYPPIMVTAGLNDPRVTYWEPAKWTAKLRATKTDPNLIILKTNMGAGHAGKSGRFVQLEETAEEYTFLLMAFGRAKR